MPLRRSVWISFALVFCFALASSWQAKAGEQHYRSRKYKAPPPTARIDVEVLKKENGQPLMNAAVVFNPFDRNGKDLGNLEVKTGPDGKATIDVIPVGSRVDVQIIAAGFATYAGSYQIDGPTKDISISMLRPRAQVSAYENNEGKASDRKWGVQEPVRPKPQTSTQPAAPPASTAPAAAPKSAGASAPKQ
ncbi:hypothetical protein [Edaphobacter sp.]|uniref:hypothetical protein n=1 Tax=Edaphobacter sp. TaxID=1934404 RepID=UPI002DBBC6AA|nr:hypothetical protein [Edaphobacter sp.]HEU5339959.1 hypothetical protein [Edaphobacter sp.]